MTDSEDESVALSANALAALQAFYSERDALADRFERLKTADDTTAAAAEQDGADADGKLSMDTFAEDWGLSQFWYAEETATLLAQQLLDGADESTVIAVVSTPSVFVALRNLLSTADPKTPKPKVYLLEQDQRFAIFPEFVVYDFAKPFTLPAHLKGGVDRLIVDPPFLSEDCQTKMALTMRWLARKPSPPTSSDDATATRPRVLVCTGERMASLVTRLYGGMGVRPTALEIVHAGLQNEYWCYANFECGAWSWREVAEGKNGEK
ncbi:putative N6-adenine methyltransferase-domain-containing protein [Xylariomycetidae sp. FL0641]|nr:putative N6-adenine methyltransferase-domain-containing protein [Xylariomycetidae sp. FL0641]